MLKRILISFVLGTLFVITLMSIGIYYFSRDKNNSSDLRHTVKIDRLSEFETIELFKKLGMEYNPKPSKPDLNIPNYTNKDKSIPLSVELNIKVKSDGTIDSINANGDIQDKLAIEQALKQLENKTYPIRFDNGVAVGYKVKEVVELKDTDFKNME